MELVRIFLEQLVDPFRIVLLFGLLVTINNTRAATGTILPAIAGVIFVASLIPVTISSDRPFVPQFLAGVPANVVILGVLHLIWKGVARLRR